MSFGDIIKIKTVADIPAIGFYRNMPALRTVF